MHDITIQIHCYTLLLNYNAQHSELLSIMDAKEFEWESQLRFYWEKEPDELVIRQCTGEFGYGYEYMGLNGRLVITPLTDRIYLTLTQVKKQIFISFNGFVNFEYEMLKFKQKEILFSCCDTEQIVD